VTTVLAVLPMFAVWANRQFLNRTLSEHEHPPAGAPGGPGGYIELSGWPAVCELDVAALLLLVFIWEPIPAMHRPAAIIVSTVLAMSSQPYCDSKPRESSPTLHEMGRSGKDRTPPSRRCGLTCANAAVVLMTKRAPRSLQPESRRARKPRPCRVFNG
jgi:hypothetical protein